MRLLSWAICSLGIWIILNSFLRTAIWDDIVFGGITAILALIGALRAKE